MISASFSDFWIQYIGFDQQVQRYDTVEMEAEPVQELHKQPNDQQKSQKQEPIQIFRQKLVIRFTEPHQQIKRYIEMIGKIMEVDKELNVDTLRKTMTFDSSSSSLTIEFGCVDLKLLRSVATGFFRHLQLVAKAIEEFASEGSSTKESAQTPQKIDINKEQNQ